MRETWGNKRPRKTKKTKTRLYIPHKKRKSIFKEMPLPWKKNANHVSLAGWGEDYCRKILVSTLDIGYDQYKEVICNGCQVDMFPNNCWLIEYSEEECDCDWRLFTSYVDLYCKHECDAEWEVYDVYCFDCGDKYFDKAQKIVFGE
jgi:hypothetical protein